MSDELAYRAFELDGRFCGVEVLRLHEVIRHPRMAMMPRAPDVVGGLINLRGQIATVTDLRRRLELIDRPDGELPVIVCRAYPQRSSQPAQRRNWGRAHYRRLQLEGRLRLVADLDRAFRLPTPVPSNEGSWS